MQNINEIKRPGDEWRVINSESQHPLHNPTSLVIETPMMEQLVKQIKQLLFNHGSGACIVGSHRIGKTTALQEIRNTINEQGELPAYCHYFSVDTLETGTVRQMYKLFCYQENINVKMRSDGLQMRELIIHRLLDRFILSGKKQIVLFIDELQRLSTIQLEAFASLHDIFQRMNINLCIIFVGNEVPSQSVLKIADKKANRLIYGRFFEYQEKIHGIQTKDELEACLTQFDLLCYPENGPSYTQHFVHPDAPNNWKLASLTDLIWSVYIKTYWPRVKKRHESFGMKYFISMVRNLLILYLNKQWTDDPSILKVMISNSIKNSKILAEQVQVVK